MHELSLAESILETIEDKAKQQHFAHVSSLTLSIGALSCVDSDTLAWYLTQISENTLLANAKIEIQTIAGVMKCNQCHQPFNSDELYCCCPLCDSYDKTITSGNEMLISHIDVIDYATLSNDN